MTTIAQNICIPCCPLHLIVQERESQFTRAVWLSQRIPIMYWLILVASCGCPLPSCMAISYFGWLLFKPTLETYVSRARHDYELTLVWWLIRFGQWRWRSRFVCVPLSSRHISGIVLLGLGVCSSSLQFRLAGQKGSDTTASNPPDLRYSKLLFKLESALWCSPHNFQLWFYCIYVLVLLPLPGIILIRRSF